MTFRAVTPADVPEVEAFLLRHIETSVFLISNLRRFGPNGAAHPYAMTFWQTDDPICGVIAQSTAGVVMAQWPNGQDWAAALSVLPKPVTDAIGDSGQMNALLHAANIRNKPTHLDADEGLFTLWPRDLIPQPGIGTLRVLRESDRATLIPWRTDYAINTLGEPKETGPARADEEITAYIAADRHRLLVDGEQPLTMTGFNATVDDVVQIGGVYTPRERRDQGLARRAVALHLEEARASGAARAILFANDPSAVAAYEAVGFVRVGRFALIMFEKGHTPQ